MIQTFLFFLNSKSSSLDLFSVFPPRLSRITGTVNTIKIIAAKTATMICDDLIEEFVSSGADLSPVYSVPGTAIDSEFHSSPETSLLPFTVFP